ncbi:MAG: nucleotidyltransferase family protein [Promethearchaeota archaeon]
MVGKEIIDNIKRDFGFLMKIPSFLGIILYGSQVDDLQTNRSDIDLCIVMNETDTKKIFDLVCTNVNLFGKKYDVHFFKELPWYIRGDILENGITVLSPDFPLLFEFLYPFRKIWNDQKTRQKLSKKEMHELLK